MASPCQLLMDVDDEASARKLVDIARAEALRIENKFSRYRDDNITWKINHSDGEPVAVDEETAALLDYAGQCYEMSDGMFDVTSGVLREVWRFDGSDNIPTKKAVNAMRARIGWKKINWHWPFVIVPTGMEIDFGGIAKEYAVDRSAQLIGEQSPASVLINFGGDLYSTGARRNGHGWMVGVEDPGNISDNLGTNANKRQHSADEFELVHGGIATSGDTRRYLLKDGVRYGHILNPKTGWPVRDAAHSITVAAGTCTEAGILAMLAMLQGRQAEAFLEEQGVQFWVQR